MDILIKNMEMPKEKDDVVILTIQPDGTTNIFGRRLLSLLRPSTEIHGLRKGITTAIEVPPHGDWHTGTPTEEGWYVCKMKGADLYETEYSTGVNWNEEIIEKWQKIEPYKEKECIAYHHQTK